jgi:hypothetical protein
MEMNQSVEENGSGKINGKMVLTLPAAAAIVAFSPASEGPPIKRYLLKM